MALSFDGTNDNVTKSSGCERLDVAVRTIAYWITVPADVTGAQQVFSTASTISAGNQRDGFSLQPRVTAGFRIRFFYLWTGGQANWDHAVDVPVGAHHIAVTYDRASSTNDPVIYLDGASVAVTETVAPSGSAQTGTAAYRFGETLGGGADLNATIWEFAYWNRTLDAAEIGGLAKHLAPSWYPRGLLAYLPMLRDARDAWGSLDGTVTGATVVPHPRTYYPGRARIAA